MKYAIGDDGYPLEPLFSVPFGLLPSAVPVILVCGPPGAGKSTYAKQNRKPEDIVIDYDDIRKSIGVARADDSGQALKRVFKLRDGMLRSLHTRTNGTCYFVTCAATQPERDAWCRALGKVRVHECTATMVECMTRIWADRNRSSQAKALAVRLIKRHFQELENA